MGQAQGLQFLLLARGVFEHVVASGQDRAILVRDGRSFGLFRLSEQSPISHEEGGSTHRDLYSVDTPDFIFVVVALLLQKGEPFSYVALNQK